MKNLFDGTSAAELDARIARVQPEAQRQWGTMTAAQALAHCSNSLEMALGDRRPARLFIGRLIGSFVKRLVLRDEAPFKRNSPTDPTLVISDARDLEVEKERLRGLVSRIANGGPAVMTTHPHSFFGRLTPEQWALLMYKHLDHHLRQFGA